MLHLKPEPQIYEWIKCFLILLFTMAVAAFAEGISKIRTKKSQIFIVPEFQVCLRAYSYKTHALLEANKLSYPILQTRLLAQEWRRKHLRLTLFLLPGPVLIMVYKLSPELLESGSKAKTKEKQYSQTCAFEYMIQHGLVESHRLMMGGSPTCRAWHDGSSWGTPTSRRPLWWEKRISNIPISIENICTLNDVPLASNTTNSNVEIFLPHMHREREMSKASEKTKQGK